MSLWDFLKSNSTPVTGAFLGRDASVALRDLAQASILGASLESFRDRSILIAARNPMVAGLALIELDGVASRMVLCTPDLPASRMPAIALTAGAELIVVDAPLEGTTSPSDAVPHLTPVVASASLVPTVAPRPLSSRVTEWVLLTSGTSGEPKLVAHTLASLTGAIGANLAGMRPAPAAESIVWSTFYDIRRYGGLQIYLRAVLGGFPLVLAEPGEPTPEFMSRVGAAGTTHISGTPSHWRRALMSGAAGAIAPRYARLSGEIADQAILDALRLAYPTATIAHAFASTEAGVAFDVADGRAGFPEALLGAGGRIDLKVEDGTLRIRSGRTASRYLGDTAAALADAEGFVDTGDLVEFRDGRYYFLGRRGGIINVGGLKVHPEEVEAVLNSDPRVQMSRVHARRNPITGSLVTAEVVLREPPPAAGDALETLRRELLDACRRTLAGHKVPATLRFVASLELTPAGKLVRPSA